VKTWIVRTCAAGAVALLPAVALAQHDDHQPAAAPSACADSARQANALLDTASARIEAARQTNQPSAMRSAIEDLQTTLAMIRAQLANCVPPAVGPAPTSTAAPAPAPSPAPRMPMVMTSTDPTRLKCPSPIDPKTAPRATFQGKTYYFCSEPDRREFLTDPAMSLSMRPPL
jgi:YHS domain-containing protein